MLVSRTVGPPMIILHEINGVTALVIEFCRMIAAAGHLVWDRCVTPRFVPTFRVHERTGSRLTRSFPGD